MILEPISDRPLAPEAYGYGKSKKGMLEWSRVQEALAAANIYWIATILPDGSPHTHSIWGSFVGSTLYFEGGPTTRWGRNLAARPRASFGAEGNGLHISGKGSVHKAPAGDDFAAVRDNYGAKFDYQPQNDDFYRLEPKVIIALSFGSMEEFQSTPTRFRFSR